MRESRFSRPFVGGINPATRTIITTFMTTSRDQDDDNDDDDDDEIGTSLLPLLKLASAHCASQALHAAIRLNIPDILDENQYSIEELSDAIIISSSSGDGNNNNNKSNKKIKKCNKDALLRTMRLLTTIDIVHEEEEVKQQQQKQNDDDDDDDGSSISIYFSLTKLGKCLRSRNSNKPSMASCIQHWMEEPLWDSWLYLSDYIIEDDNNDNENENDKNENENEDSNSDSDLHKNENNVLLPFERANDGISSDYYYNEIDHPESLKHANDFVKLIHEQEINAIVNWDYWSLHCRGKRLVDIGGHNGLLVAAIAQKEPTIDCYCLDLPEVILNSSMNEKIKQIIEQNNVTMVPGNVFDSQTIPSCDVILMKHFCDRCMWTDEETVQILKSCSSALIDADTDTDTDTGTGTAGKIIIADAVLPDVGYNTQEDAVNNNEQQQLALYLDALYMLVGRERQRTKMEWEKLASLSNLNLVSVHSTNVPSCSIIVMEKKAEIK
jgi:hypothetical protein